MVGDGFTRASVLARKSVGKGLGESLGDSDDMVIVCSFMGFYEGVLAGNLDRGWSFGLGFCKMILPKLQDKNGKNLPPNPHTRKDP